MKKHKWWIFGCFALKLLLLISFSSDYKDLLFVPFIDLHSQHLLGNPWEFVFRNHLPMEFPYPPLTLWILTLFYLPLKFFGLGKVLFSLPLLLADLAIFFSLDRLVPNREKSLIAFYLFSPIVLFATYMHSQLDVLSTSFLVGALLFLYQKKNLQSLILLGLALSAKSHIIVILPLIFIYYMRNRSYKTAFASVVVPVGIYLIISLPYLFSPGYASLVLNNQKQNSIFDSFINIEDLKIYLPLLAILCLYGRFASYRKINFDLFVNFIGISFTVFLMLVKPSPGWYIWVVPFLTLLLLRQQNRQRATLAFLGFGSVYLLYFLVFHTYDYHPLNFMGYHLHTEITNAKLANIVFTMLFATMLLTVFLFYKSGIRSNDAYKKLKAFAIGIGGDSGSGKTTLLDDLHSLFGASLLQIEGDGEHRWERGDKNWQRMTHLDPRANHLHSQAQTILKLKQYQSVYRRDYDHDSGKFTDPVLLSPTDFIVISGLHPFYLPIMRKILDLKIFMHPDESLRQHWKIVRDIQNRGYSKEKILQQIQAREDDKQRFISPQLGYADVIIRFFSDDQFEVGNPEHFPRVSVQVTLDASFHLETILDELHVGGYEVSWTYSDDLKHQEIILRKEQLGFSFTDLAIKHIVNIHELINMQPFAVGYRGFSQFIILFAISQKMRGITDDYDAKQL